MNKLELLFKASDLIIETLDRFDSYPLDTLSTDLEKKEITNLIFNKALQLLKYESMVEENGARGLRLTGKGISHAVKGISIKKYFNETTRTKKLERRHKMFQMGQAIATFLALGLSIFNLWYSFNK